MENKTIYHQLGLTEKQILIYDHLLNHGPHTVAKLADETKLHRGIVFYIVKELLQKELVEHTTDSAGKAAYSATHPVTLLNIYEKKQAELELHRKQLEAELPTLITNYSLTNAKPGVVYFEGAKEFQKIYDDILRTGKNYKDIFSAFDYHEVFNKNANTKAFRDRRLKEKIGLKLLFKATDKRLKEYMDNTSPLREVRFVEEAKLQNPSEIIIYGTKVALISFNPTLLATVIDNKDITETFNQLFDYIWDTTKPYHDKVVAEITEEKKKP